MSIEDMMNDNFDGMSDDFKLNQWALFHLMTGTGKTHTTPSRKILDCLQANGYIKHDVPIGERGWLEVYPQNFSKMASIILASALSDKTASISMSIKKPEVSTQPDLFLLTDMDALLDKEIHYSFVIHTMPYLVFADGKFCIFESPEGDGSVGLRQKLEGWELRSLRKAMQAAEDLLCD